MSDYVPADGSLNVSQEAHDFMSSLEYNSKISKSTQISLFMIKQKNDFFKFGFAIGYTKRLDIDSTNFNLSKDISSRNFPLEAYRLIITEEAIEREMSIGGLLSAYADAGLLHLKQELEAGKDLIEILGYSRDM
jgi:hypothetical protein